MSLFYTIFTACTANIPLLINFVVQLQYGTYASLIALRYNAVNRYVEKKFRYEDLGDAGKSKRFQMRVIIIIIIIN